MSVQELRRCWRKTFDLQRCSSLAITHYPVLLLVAVMSSSPTFGIAQQTITKQSDLVSPLVPMPPTDQSLESTESTQPLRVIESIATKRYNLAERASTGWIKLGGAEVPVDDPVEFEGKKIYLTLFYDVVVLDPETNEAIWTLEWGKTKPIWETISIVRIERAGKASIAVELRPQGAIDDATKFEYHDFSTGELLVSALSEEPAATSETTKAVISIEPVISQNEVVRIAQLKNSILERSASRLQSLLDSAKPPEGGLPGRVMDELKIVESNSVTEVKNPTNTQLVVSDVRLNLVGGIPLHVEFFGAKVEIQNSPENSSASVTCDRLVLLDSLGVVRAIVRSAEADNSLEVTCSVEGDSIGLQCNSTVANEALSVRLASQTGAGANEKVRPHQAVRFRIDVDANTPATIGMVLERHYDTRRLAAELKSRLETPLTKSQVPQSFALQTSYSFPGVVPPSGKSSDDEGWGIEVNGLKTRLTLQTENPIVGQPVLMKYEVKNVSASTRPFDPQRSAAFRVLEVQRSNGELDLYVGGSFQTSGREEKIESGETRVLFENVDISKLYLLSEPSAYRVRCRASDIPESNTVEMQLGEGQVEALKKILMAIQKSFPNDKHWTTTLSGETIIVSHAGSNLKKDVTTIQLWFTQEELDRDFELGSGTTKQTIHRLGKHELGFANVASSAQATVVMPDYLQKIRDALEIE